MKLHFQSKNIYKTIRFLQTKNYVIHFKIHFKENSVKILLHVI